MIVLYAIIGLILALLVIASILPSRYHIEKAIIIKKPLVAVMDKVANLHHYAQWNPWQKKEPSAKAEISGTPATKGHQYKWDGKKIGAGSLTLRDIDSKHVHFDLEFIRPFKSRASDNWLFEEWGTGETKVTWQNNGVLPYPVGRLIGGSLTKTLNKQFEEGLQNLKVLAESA
jgi:hypothetical protein